MDELDERLNLLQTCGFVDEIGREDLESIVRVLTQEYGVSRDSELLGTLVTHVAAAMKRVREGEEVNPLSEEVLNDVYESAVYANARHIQQEILSQMNCKLPAAEEDFLLVHIGGLLLAQENE